MSDTYLAEFLWRGHPPSSGQPPAWHLILGTETKDAVGVSRVTYTDALTPTQAEAAGHSLSSVIEALDAHALTLVDDLRTEIAVLQEQKAALEEQLASRETLGATDRVMGDASAVFEPRAGLVPPMPIS